jgi:hypothetical protein
MLSIVRSGSWQLIPCSQDPTKAWQEADRLTRETGIYHCVGRH